MARTLMPQYKTSMVEFGRVLKLLRSPDLYQYKYRLAQRGATKAEKEKLNGALDDGLNVEYLDALIAREDLPKSYRDLQVQARRLGMQIYTLRDVAKRLGISKNTLHDYEQGKHYPPIEFIFQYCEALNLPLDEVLSEWFRCHPDERIAHHAKSALSQSYFDGFSDDRINKNQSSVIGYFNRALYVAMASQNFAFSNDPDKLLSIAEKLVHMIKKTLDDGLEFEPDNIDVTFLNLALSDTSRVR